MIHKHLGCSLTCNRQFDPDPKPPRKRIANDLGTLTVYLCAQGHEHRQEKLAIDCNRRPITEITDETD